MKKVTFIFPPFLPSASKSPYLAPHLLTTLLREKGHEVENLDLNNQFVRRMGKRHVLEAVEAYYKTLLADKSRDKTANFFVLSGLTHLELLKEKMDEGEKIHYEALVTNANYIKDYIFQDLKSIHDYRERGMNVLPAVKNELMEMIETLDLSRTICLSCAFGDQLPFTLEIARQIKLKSPSTHVILGGAQVSLLPKELIDEIARYKMFNLVFTGFAEEKISDVIENCPDTYFTEPMTGSTATTKMLDALPQVQFDGMENYDNPLIPVLVNKGCYWGKCSFCDYILMGDLGGFRYISRSVDIVYDEIKALRAKYPDYRVNLISDAVPPKFYKELAIKANSENFPLRTYSYMINNKNLTEDFFKEAGQAQIGIIVFGTESTSDRVLELMQKQGRRADILENFRLAKKYGVNLKVNLIPNYPTTTYEEAQQTIADIASFQDSISMLAVFKFYLSANTKMDQAPENYDLDVDPNLPYLKSQNNGYHSREFQRKNGMTAEQEAEVFLKLRNINIMCSMNDTKKKFKKLWEEKGFHGLRLSTDYKLVEDNGQYMVYSYKKGMLFYVTKDDYNVISALKDGKINMHRLEKLLGSSAHMWCEKYFFFEILEYEKTAISAIVA
jgi:radical SAM superfamily enzyme YgiQ (UPF0313 family)